MELNLEQAFDGPVDLSQTFDVPRERLARPEILSLQPVGFAGQLQKVDVGFVLLGRINLFGSVACARCLTEVPFERSASVSWTFAPAHEKPNEDDLELASADLDVVWYDELRVPFDPLIDEQIQLELPLKPLCREECRGLCPSCGVDRNTTSCACVETPDERWSALKTLLSPSPGS